MKVQNSNNPFSRHLEEEMELQGYSVAGKLGRKLFESGHFGFAELSTLAGLGIGDARNLLTSHELATHLNPELWGGLRSLQSLIYTTELCLKLSQDFETYLKIISQQEMNRIRTRPTFSEVGLNTQKLYKTEAGVLKLSLLDCSTALDGLHGSWHENFEQFLAKPKASPEMLKLLLPTDCVDSVFKLATSLRFHLDILNHCQSYFYNSMLQTYQPFGFKQTRSPFVESVREFDALRVHTFMTAKHIAKQSQPNLIEIERFCAISLDFIYQGFSLIHLCRDDLSQFAEQPNQALLNENFYYAESLEKQLCAMGISQSVSLQMKTNFFAYCEQHTTRAIDVLDDELHKICPTISKESIAVARLKVRLEDDSFPLSVKFKESIEKAFGK